MHNKNPSVVNEANRIVTNHLMTAFLDEVDYFMTICLVGERFLVMTDNRVICILDAISDDSAEGFIKKFCTLFTDKTEILVNIECIDDDDTDEPYLKMTLQSGSVFYIHDFSNNYFQI